MGKWLLMPLQKDTHIMDKAIRDQIWEKPPLMHKDKYLEIHNLIIQ